ncbi:MAG: anthranilate phosphoribosyltransferase [Pirellulaceae bacterium]
MNENTDPFDHNDLYSEAISLVRERSDLTMECMRQLVCGMMNGRLDEQQSAELLSRLHHKGESVDELVGAATAMREFMTPIRSSRVGAIDTCGTGGGGTNTFNISTAVALVCAGAGVPVAKHGNKRSTSKSGSSDVLQELGVNINASVEVVEKCLDELGLCFCFAPLFHPSVKRVMAVRRSLPHPTIFNLLGPLCNPASTPFQLLGVGRGETQLLIAQALCRLGTQRSKVVHGRDGLGEVTICESTDVIQIENGDLNHETIDATAFGITPAPLKAIQVNSAEESAARIRNVLANHAGPEMEIVVLNAAVACEVVGRVGSIEEGISVAREVLAKGIANELLQALVRLTNE